MRAAALITSSLILLALVIGAWTTPPAASAASHRADHERVRALKSEVRRLTRRVDAQQRALNAAASSVTTRTVERDRALARATTTQAELDSRPSALTAAVEHVRREVVHSEYVLAEASVPYQHEAIVARAAMTYVVGHVSAPAYGYMNKTLGTRPLPTAESVLGAGSGICGHAALTFAAIIKRFKIPVRSVQFYYADGVNNHIAAEVFYDGVWHYYDPTWGALYADARGRVLSIDEARAHPEPDSLLQQDGTLLWRWILSLAGVAPLGGETDPSTRVEIDKQPFSGR
jgi:transglutaminase-like putative cysteine protease